MTRNALVVGINQYQHLKNLSAPAKDAEAIAQRLEQYSDFRVQRFPEVIVEEDLNKAQVAKHSNISSDNLEDAIKQLFLPESSQAPDSALFYFSGHGLRSDDKFHKGFLCASDTNPTKRRSGLSLAWLQSILAESPIKQQIVWLDCCHSGSLLVNVGAANPGNGESRDRCFIASSRDFEESWQDLNSPYSVLTKALIDGLDPTRLPDGEIDTFSLVNFVSKAMRGELQSPVCTNFGDAIHLTRSLQVETPISKTNKAGRDVCPYKGLEYFDCNDTDPKFFFGRDRLISKLLDHVRTTNFLALVGASGNGKSSVLRAGLLHQLKLGQRITGSEKWRIRITRPDQKPMENLALAFVEEGLADLDRAEALGKAKGLLSEGSAGLTRLIQASSAPKTILVIDQFEEVFTRCLDLNEREKYFECLIGALAPTQDKLCLIIAMRADFIVKCMEREYSGLARWIDQHQVSVLPMQAEEQREAICKPALQVALDVEPLLVTEIQTDLASAPGSLPLLQFTLKALWQRRTNNQLTLQSYQDLGGIAGALDQRATEIYNSFEQTEQSTIRHIFLQLTQLGEGAEDTRRRVFQTDLVSDPHHPKERVQRVIEELSNQQNRLLVTSEIISKGDRASRMAIIDVAHEALIRHWKLLRSWIEENRDLLRKQRKIEASAIAWREQGNRKGDLLQGLSLDEAIHFKKKESDNFPLSDSAQSFIQKCQKQRFIDRLKIASWLIIPTLLIFGVIEYNLREASIKQDFARLGQEGTYEEKRAVQDLVKGCRHHFYKPNYITERIYGTCRSLANTPLARANLHNTILINADFLSADLRNADLRSADLRYAFLSNATLIEANLSTANLSHSTLRYTIFFDSDLSGANLSNADLVNAFFSNTNLSDANLSNANLSFVNINKTNLRNANLSNAIFLANDLRDTQGLTNKQLQTKTVFICNSPLPSNLKIDRNRDCDQIAMKLAERYPQEFKDQMTAQQYVEQAKQKMWD